jgi:hypothetical protein
MSVHPEYWVIQHSAGGVLTESLCDLADNKNAINLSKLVAFREASRIVNEPDEWGERTLGEHIEAKKDVQRFFNFVADFVVSHYNHDP